MIGLNSHMYMQCHADAMARRTLLVTVGGRYL